MTKSRSYTSFRCWKCGKMVDTTIPDKEPYFHSITHGIYMHLKCFEQYERELLHGKAYGYAQGRKK